MSEVSLERDRVGFMRVTSLSFFFSFFFFGPVELEEIPSFLTFCFRIIDIKNVDLLYQSGGKLRQVLPIEFNSLNLLLRTNGYGRLR